VKITTWNVNGLRSALRSGLPRLVLESAPDILCLQEVKLSSGDIVPDLVLGPRYHAYYNCADTKGYAGVAVFTRTKPDSWSDRLFTCSGADRDGRSLLLEYENFSLLNLYIPHGGRDKSRLDYKLRVFDELIAFLGTWTGQPLLMVGDFNVAHHELDLARPKQNQTNTMFTPAEREKLDELETLGFIDAYRFLHPSVIGYTWWPFASDARNRNVGWRIDYQFVHEDLVDRISKVSLRQDVQGSDHCPVDLEISVALDAHRKHDGV
jgi:exodeoxyribonuclease III